MPKQSSLPETIPQQAYMAAPTPMDASTITPDYYLTHYWQYLSRYIANGRPAEDTMKYYCFHIDSFIKWCLASKIHPLSVSDYQMRIYLEKAWEQKYSENTVSIKIASIKAFFFTARKLGLISIDPCEDIKATRKDTYDEQFKFYSNEQMQDMCDYIKEVNADNDFIKYRDILIIYLMGVEGLRNVEVSRLCDEDINFEYKTINVRGKGHGGIIYPCDETFDVISKYLAARPQSRKDGHLTPTIVSDHRHNYKRISKNGVRDIMNRILTGCGLKYKGYSCHILRHSCGTNLYKETKDIRLVQEQLRHSNPKMTARYAHVHERMTNRKTSAIAPKLD